MIFIENIFSIEKMKSHVYVINTGKNIVQIDCGIEQDAKKIINFYDSKKYEPDYILITAVDYLHVGALKEIYEKYKPKIYVSKYEMDTLKNGLQLRGIEEMEGKGLEFATVKAFNSYASLDLDGFEKIDTPGYTDGNVSIYYHDKNALFTGDAAYVKKGKLYFDPMFVKSEKLAEESLSKIEKMRPVYIFPSHGDPAELK